MKFIDMRIEGCCEIQLQPYSDMRGALVKSFSRSLFEARGLETNFVEMFYTTSTERVLRGMHLVLPPADHSKLVCCLTGRVMDVVLDVRRGSPSYGCHDVVELAAGRSNAAYMPRGVAHGFYVLEAPATLIYMVTSEYVPHLDAGIAWNSFGAPWPDASPCVSPRDAAFPPLEEFDSPFYFPATVNGQPR